MKDKIYFLLEELKTNFTESLLNDTLTCMSDEISVNDFYEDGERSKNVLNGQNEKFYNQLALDFVEDLNEVPVMYFLAWEPLLYLFNSQTQSYFLNFALEIALNSDAADYIRGIQELQNNNTEIAMYYFNRIDHYISGYFMAICYLGLENFENAIKQHQQLLENLSIELDNVKDIYLAQDAGIIILKWNIYDDLAYSFNRLSEFEKALYYFNKSLQIFDLKENYKLKHAEKINDNLDSFQIFANNYLLALERTNNYTKCIEVLNFLIKKYPFELSYESRLKKIQSKSVQQEETEIVFNQIIKPRKAFDINSFEATKLVSKEKILEDMIVEQIKYGFEVFEKQLEIYQDKNIFGRQYRIPEINGILDLLLIDKSNDQLYIVELKRNESGIEVVTQIENYMLALSKQLNRAIKGIICLHKSNNKLRELVNTKNNIELYTYNFEFRSEK